MVATHIFFIFTPEIGEDSNLDEYFSTGLKPPTSGVCFRRQLGGITYMIEAHEKQILVIS